jgi:hypothetical protein
MVMMSFDAEDSALIAVVAFAAAVMAGLGSFSAFGVALSDTTSFAGASFSMAYLLTAGAFAATIYTNEASISSLRNRASNELPDTYYYALGGSALLLVAWPFVGGVQSFIQSQDLWGVLFIFASVAAQVAIGYMK